jgi:hypothetical protein
MVQDFDVIAPRDDQHHQSQTARRQQPHPGPHCKSLTHKAWSHRHRLATAATQPLPPARSKGNASRWTPPPARAMRAA